MATIEGNRAAKSSDFDQLGQSDPKDYRYDPGTGAYRPMPLATYTTTEGGFLVQVEPKYTALRLNAATSQVMTGLTLRALLTSPLVPFPELVPGDVVHDSEAEVAFGPSRFSVTWQEAVAEAGETPLPAPPPPRS